MYKNRCITQTTTWPKCLGPFCFLHFYSNLAVFTIPRLLADIQRSNLQLKSTYSSCSLYYLALFIFPKVNKIIIFLKLNFFNSNPCLVDRSLHPLCLFPLHPHRRVAYPHRPYGLAVYPHRPCSHVPFLLVSSFPSLVAGYAPIYG